MADSSPAEGADPDLELEGQHDHTVDGKGRVSIPADFRGALGLEEGSELVVTRPLKERCLMVFWPSAWSAYKEKIDALPRPLAKEMRKVVCGVARRVKIDRLGRIQLPAVQRRFARLDGKCFVMGQGACMHIWSVDVWEDATAPEQYDDEKFDLSEYDI